MEHKQQNYHHFQDLPQVLVLQPPPFFKYHEEKVAKKFRLLKAWESPLPQDEFLNTHAHSVEAILCSGVTSVNAAVIRLLPALRLIVTDSAGLNHIDLPECRSLGVAVASAGNIFSKDGADMAVGLLIDVMRKISAADRYVRQGLWSVHYPLGSELEGKRVGIVGLGNIGTEIAKRLEGFGCVLSYNSRKKKPSFKYPFYSNVQDLAANSDVLVVCCALTDQTRHMIGKEVLMALGKQGVIINVGRGPIINEKEMVWCLVEGQIKGAGLDVFENEPDVPKELFGLDNVVLSPHRAVFTEESFKDLCELMIGNLEAFFSHRPLLSQVMDD